MKRKSGFLKAILGIVISLTLIATFLPTAFAAGSDPALISATNPTLYAALHATPYLLDPDGDGTITQTEMANLSGNLDLSSKGLLKVDGLEYATKIKDLNLSGNDGLTSILPLDGDNGMLLESLNLSGTHVASLPSDLQLPNLGLLIISNDPAISNEGLAGIDSSNLPKLETLVARGCSNLQTFDSIKAVNTLTTLYLDGSTLTDITGLPDMSGMTSLRYLSLAGIHNLHAMTHLYSITAIPSFHTLSPGNEAELVLSDTDITNVSWLNHSAAPGMTILYWKSSPTLTASDISSLATLTQLKQLSLEGDSGIGNTALTTIAGLPNLVVLNVDNCGISNISPLSIFHDMEQLYISHNPVSNISALADMAKLNTFYATYTGINDISVLANLNAPNPNPLKDVNLAVDYLDPTPGSADMTIINALKNGGCNVTYNDQSQTTIHFFCDSAIFEDTLLHPLPDMIVYYGQNILLPVPIAKSGFAMTGWSTDGDYQPDFPGGKVIPFTWAPLPITGNEVTFYAINTSFDPGHHNLRLSALTASATLAPAFDPDTSYYSISLPTGVASVTLTPQVSASGTTFTINEEAVASKAIPVDPGATVTAAINVMNSGSGMQYFVSITRDTHCTITFDPQNGSPTTNHAAVYGDAIATPATPTKAGYDFDGWYPTAACNTTKIAFPYTAVGDATLYAKWEAPSQYLSGISLSGGYTLPFVNTKTSYKLTIGENDSSITITPTKENVAASMWIAGQAVPSYTTPTINNGKSLTVSIKVKYGTKSKTYLIKITRNKSTNNLLDSIGTNTSEKVTGFDPLVQDSYLVLGEFTKKVTLTANVHTGLAKATYTKTISLDNGGSKIVKITVKAQSGAKNYYYVHISRAKSTNADLKSLKVSGYALTPPFSAGGTGYSITVPANKTTVTVSAAKSDSHAAMTINTLNKTSLKVPVPSGSGPVATVTIVVNAQDTSIPPKTYIITILRP